MEETYEEYKREQLDDIRISAQIEGMTPYEYFQTKTLDDLVAMGELVDPEPLEVDKRGRSNRAMGFDAYAIDEDDHAVILISNEYRDSLDDTLNMTEINRIRTKMLNFVEEAFDGTLYKYFDMNDDALAVGKTIGRMMNVDYVSDVEVSIDKIKLIIITNQDISERVRELPSSEFLGKKVILNIWGPQRFYELDRSGKEREAVHIKTENFGLDGIPCLKAEMTGSLDYDAYLAIIPGEFLHKIYYEYGTRLLEGNVRAYLSNRGKINSAIRSTIRNEPTKFFTYNNGIACTAASVTLSEDGKKITEMEDLQIINGGQTTASLTSAATKDKASLENIFVQMKLTVVRNDEEYDDIVQKISEYSNKQNKVTDADFFSNHPFHRKFAELASRNAVVLSDGIGGSYWYYERSRGKYEQEQFKLNTKKKVDDFRQKYPKSQMIKKEELAKYFTAAELMRPDLVCLGANKLMREFGGWIDKDFKNHPDDFNNEFYRRCICYAIIYRETDRIVNKAEWYNKGGYKLDIVPYTVSKLFSLIPEGYVLDFDRIWKKQEMYPSLVDMIRKIAPATNRFVQDSGGIIVTEYCKREKTWDRYKDMRITLSVEFYNDLVSTQMYDEKKNAEKKSEKMDSDIDVEVQIYNLGSEYWGDLLEEGNKRGLLSPTEINLLKGAASLSTPEARFLSDRDMKYIWRIRKKLGEKGVLI